MLEWQASEQKQKLPQLRRKLDRAALEEAAQLCALLVALRGETMSQHDVTEAVTGLT